MDSSRKCAPDTGWLQQAGARARAFWPEKMFGTILSMAAFFTVYFWLLRHPIFPLTTIPFTAVDRWIGFQPGALPLYLSLWLYVSLAPALLSDRGELVSYGVAAMGLSIIGFGIFLFWPTQMPWPPANWPPSSPFAFLKSVDASANACPSMHAAFAVFTAIGFERILRQMGAGRLVRALNWLWCLGILYSTIAVRQHVSLDILAGAVLGAAVAVAHQRLNRTRKI
jgi:membrane-associated phospholipid phosphatase